MTLFCPSNFDVIRSSLPTLIASIAYILVRVHSTEKCPSRDQIAHLLSVAAKYRVTHLLEDFIGYVDINSVSYYPERELMST